MLTEKPQFKKWITFAAVLGFVGFMAYLFLFTDFTAVGRVIGGTNVLIYIMAFVCVICSTVFNALNWKAILNSLSVETTFKRIFNLTWVGTFVDTLIPGGWTGDVFKTYLLAKDQPGSGSKAAASIIIKDVLELLVILGSLIVGMVLLLLNYTVSGVLIIAIGITLLFLAMPLIAIIYLSTNISATEKLLRAIERFGSKIRKKQSGGEALQEKVHKQLTDFREGVMIIKSDPKSMVKPTVYQVFTAVFDVLTLYFVFIALGEFIGIDKVVITNTIVSNIQGQGVMLAGFSQIVSSQLYTVLGISAVVAVASSLLAGFASFWFRLVLSFAYFQVTVFERCVPFFCNKCIGWTAWRTKSCPEPKPKKARKWF